MKTIPFLIFIFSALLCQSQGLNDKFGEFILFSSGYKKVKVYENENLDQIWDINSDQLKIIKYHIMPLTDGWIGPNYENYSVKHKNLITFHKHGGIDSIVGIRYDLVNYIEPGQVDFPNNPDTIIDTLFVKYSYPLLSKSPINRKILRKGKDEKSDSEIEIDVFGYDPDSNLILILEDFGRVPYYFHYDSLGRINQETIFYNTDVKYKYDDLNNKILREWGKGRIEYHYDKNLRIKEIHKGKSERVITYKYEQ